MVLEKREVNSSGRRDVYCIPGSANKVINERGKYFVVDPDGKVVSKRYDNISEFKNGLAVVHDKSKTKKRFPAEDITREVDVFKKNVIDVNGKELFSTSYDNIHMDGKIIRICKGEKWGFTNLTGKVLCAPKYTFLERFINGYARIRNDEERWGIISIAGRVSVQPSYYSLGSLSGTVIVAENYRGYGGIDIRGKEMIPFRYKKQCKDDDGKTVLYNSKEDRIAI